MASPRTALLSLLALVGALSTGCATPFTDQAADGLDTPNGVLAADDKPPTPVAPEHPGSAVPHASRLAAPAPDGPLPPERLVSQVQGLDPAVQARLLADLKQTDPALWPELLRTFQVATNHGRADAQPNHAPPRQTFDGASAAGFPAVASGLRDHPYHPLEHRTKPIAPSAMTPTTQPTPSGGLSEAFSARRDPHAALASLNDPLDGAAAGAAQVNYESPNNSAEDALTSAIRALETADATNSSGSRDSTRKRIELRLLCLAAGRRDEALRPIPGLTAAEQEFWSSQLFALAAWLDADKIPAADRRANEALTHLDAARGKLAELGGLQVRNPQFCTRVDGYGSFTKFKEYAFKPGQDVVLYVELDNFRCESTDGGYRTALSSRYRILDSQSKQVTEHEFPAIEEVCQNRRRDYYVSFRVTLPQRIYNGRHTLQLTVEDTLGKKVGQTSIEFTIQE